MELNICMAQGKQDVLLKKLNDALAIDEENVTLLFVRGNVYDNFASGASKIAKNGRDTSVILSKKAKAQTVAAQRTKLENSAKYYFKLSDSLFRMNKEYVAKAEADYIKVIELKDDYIDAYFNLGALTNNKTTEIVEKMNAISAPSQAEYDKKWALMKKDQDAILTVALGYFTKALEYAEALPTTTEADKTYKNGTMVSILISMQQVYANLGDEKKTMETKRRRMEIGQ
jgi:tetratricopeptide (TPR) repeat protein